MAPFVGQPERLERYFARLAPFPPALKQVASACYEDAILDLGSVVIQSGRIAKLMAQLAEKAKEFGLAMSLVGTPELKKVLAGFEETRTIPIFQTITEARAQAV